MLDRHRDALEQELSPCVIAGKVADFLAHYYYYYYYITTLDNEYNF